MATQRITVTIPSDVMERLRERARGNVSAYVTKAVRRELDLEVEQERAGVVAAAFSPGERPVFLGEG